MGQRIGNRLRTKELLCAYMFYAIIRHECELMLRRQRTPPEYN